MKGSVLFIDTVHPLLQFQLEEKGWNCVDGSTWTVERTREEIANFDGIIIRSRFRLDQSILQNATKLKFIARAGAGMENIETGTYRLRNL